MTRRDEIIGAILSHRDEIRRLGVERLDIFGSAARDEAGPDSDIDVRVLFNEETQSGSYFEAYLALQRTLEFLLGRKVDLVTEAGIKPRLRPYVEKDLVRVLP